MADRNQVQCFDCYWSHYLRTGTYRKGCIVELEAWKQCGACVNHNDFRNWIEKGCFPVIKERSYGKRQL